MFTQKKMSSSVSKAQECPEFCVMRIAVRYKPPTFLVEYSISRGDESKKLSIHHEKITIIGLSSSSDPIHVARTLIEHCHILRHSLSLSTGLTLNQILGLCQKLVEPPTHRLDEPRLFGSSVKGFSKYGSVIPLASDGKQEKNEKAGEGTEQRRHETYFSDCHPPLPCVFLPHQRERTRLLTCGSKLDTFHQNNGERNAAASASKYHETNIKRSAIRPTDVSNLLKSLKEALKNTGLNARNADLFSVTKLQGHPAKISSFGEERTVTCDILLSAYNRVGEEPNNGRLHSSHQSDDGDVGRFNDILHTSHQSCDSDDSNDPSDNSEHDDCQRDRTKSTVVWQQEESIEHSQEYYKYDDDFEEEEQSFLTSNIEMKEAHNNATNSHSGEFSNYSEAFEEEELTTATPLVDPSASNSISPNAHAREKGNETSNLMVTPIGVIFSSSSQYLPYRGQQLWATDYGSPISCKSADVKTTKVNESEHNSTDYTISTEIETPNKE